MNTAWADTFPPTRTVQVELVPVHAPVQLEKTNPVVGAAVIVITVPSGTEALQVFPQLMPLSPITVPFPDVETPNLNIWAKLAVTFIASVMLSVQVSAFPAHAPPQPRKMLPLFALAVTVTGVLRL